MKPKLKYVIWLRNILVVLLVVILVDWLVRRYYDPAATAGLSYGPIMGVVSLVFLQYYVRSEQRNERNE